MSEWVSITIASLAIVISVISFVWNWRHSESVLRRTRYPAVAWHRPILSRRDNNTVISVTVCNHGPTEIADVWLGASLCSRFKTEAWGKTNPMMSVPIGEELELIITDSLEEDIRERFSSLHFDESWRCEGKLHNYKVGFRFEYQPLIADTSPVVRKAYYLLTPISEDGAITHWHIEPISWLRRLLPTF